MPMDLTAGFGLDADFAQKLTAVLAECAAAGYEFRPSQGLRTPQVQADYYCGWEQRSPADIDAAAAKLEQKGAPWIASLLRERRSMKRQKDWQTSALPGAGWHQWGLAVDCYCFRNGKLVGDGGDPCYKFYAKAAQKHGLRAGLYFSKPDAGHLQARQEDTASHVYAWSLIDATMKERFGPKPSVSTSSITPAAATAAPMAAGSVVAATAGSTAPAYYKNSATLIGVPLAPAHPKQLAGDATLAAMAKCYNRVGGLIEAVAGAINVDPVAMLAVWLVESGGATFSAGKPVMRFENHILWKYWGSANPTVFDAHFRFGGHAGVEGKQSKKHQFRASASDDWTFVHQDKQELEWAAFNLAVSLAGKEAASLSSSWGGPQVMGFNYGNLGYSSAAEMTDAFTADERWHVLGFADFCNHSGCLKKIQQQKWVAFGACYNGDGPTYGPKIEAVFNRRSDFLALPNA